MRGGESFGERILREMLENITEKETYMNEMARKLRDASVLMKGAFVTSTYAISLVRKALDAGSTPTFAGDLGAVLDVIADELDALEDKAERRRSHIVQLESTIAERNRELRELRGQIPTDKERRILDMWPRFEDTGEPVMVGDAYVDTDGDDNIVAAVRFDRGCADLVGAEGFYTGFDPGERVKRPARRVLDADGVEIKVGDTVWHEDGSELRVIDFGGVEDGETMLGVEYVAGPTKWGEVRCLSVTHTRPDSWERLEEDMAKHPCVYAEDVKGGEFSRCSECPWHSDCGGARASEVMARDIVRRAKALAGVEQ